MCGHGRERRSAGHPVDGFCSETNTLFHLHACLWHCCPRCFPGRPKEVVAFEKTKKGKRGLTREMQFARTLERRQAILDEGFQLIVCREHDFKRRQLYPKKKRETFPHIIVFDFELVLDTSKRKKAPKCRCPFCWQRRPGVVCPRKGRLRNFQRRGLWGAEPGLLWKAWGGQTESVRPNSKTRRCVEVFWATTLTHCTQAQ